MTHNFHLSALLNLEKKLVKTPMSLLNTVPVHFHDFSPPCLNGQSILYSLSKFVSVIGIRNFSQDNYVPKPAGHEQDLNPGRMGVKGTRDRRNRQHVCISDQAVNFIFSQEHLYSQQARERVGCWNIRSRGIL